MAQVAGCEAAYYGAASSVLLVRGAGTGQVQCYLLAAELSQSLEGLLLLLPFYRPDASAVRAPDALWVGRYLGPSPTTSSAWAKIGGASQRWTAHGQPGALPLARAGSRALQLGEMAPWVGVIRHCKFALARWAASPFATLVWHTALQGLTSYVAADDPASTRSTHTHRAYGEL